MVERAHESQRDGLVAVGKLEHSRMDTLNQLDLVPTSWEGRTNPNQRLDQGEDGLRGKERARERESERERERKRERKREREREEGFLDSVHLILAP